MGGDRNDVVSVQQFNQIVNELRRQNFEAKVSAEVNKHRSPQIKRSLQHLMTLEFLNDNIMQVFNRLQEAVQNGEQVHFDDFKTIEDGMKEMSVLMKDEIMYNQMASKSRFGWRTVKFFVNDNLFEGERADELTKKFRQAEINAGKPNPKRQRFNNGGFQGGVQSFQGGNNGGRQFVNVGRNGGGFGNGGGASGGFGGGRSNGGFVNGGGADLNRGYINRNEIICHGCKMPGHIRRNCPKSAERGGERNA